MSITDNRHDQSLQRQGRKTPGNVAGGRVLVRSRRRSVDLASKIKEKCKKKKKKKKMAKNHPADDTLARPLLQRRHFEMNSPAKMKEITKKSN
jgi:hypothetical protein